MADCTRWIELLACPECGRSGLAHFSQPDGRAYDASVDDMPAGFKVAHHQFGELFLCEACNRPAMTDRP